MIRNKSILLVSPLNKIGGKANFTSLLISTFDKNNVKYNHIDLIRAKSKNKVLRVLEHVFSFFYYKLKFVFLLTTKKFDVVQIHTSTGFDFWDLSILIVISKLFRKKTYVRYGGAIFQDFYSSAGKIKKSYINWMFSLYDVFIVQSKFWRDYFTSVGIGLEKIYILPNFVDDTIYNFERAQTNINEISILFMPATSLNRKGFYDLKDSISLLASKHPNVNFHIVGPEVNKHIGDQNIFTHKELYGEDKIRLFAACHIFLLPTHNEGFPNALLEAMAAGMGIITTNIPQISCLVEDNKHCLLMSPGAAGEFKDKLEFLIRNPEEITRLGISAKKLVEEKFSTNLMADYLKRLYNG